MLLLNRQGIADGSEVSITDIGTDSAAVMCITDQRDCCSSQGEGSGYFPMAYSLVAMLMVGISTEVEIFKQFY